MRRVTHGASVGVCRLGGRRVAAFFFALVQRSFELGMLSEHAGGRTA